MNCNTTIWMLTLRFTFSRSFQDSNLHPGQETSNKRRACPPKLSAGLCCNLNIKWITRFSSVAPSAFPPFNSVFLIFYFILGATFDLKRRRTGTSFELRGDPHVIPRDHGERYGIITMTGYQSQFVISYLSYVCTIVSISITVSFTDEFKDL